MRWLLAVLLLLAQAAHADVASTKHNLSISGPGTIKAASESQICVFCHAPHNSSPSAPLWNRRDPGSTYTPYTSSTAKASAGQPTGASLTCLSCHDGTIALGELLSRKTVTTMAGGVTTLPAGNSNLGTDLSDDHPISIAYTTALAAARNGELADPSTLTGKVKLDNRGQMQCTSCHDPHDNTNGKFLSVPNTASALCITCHTKSGWSASDHKLSNATWKGTGTNPWPHTTATTVAANACESCHRPHSAGGKKGLLNSATEENNCYTCHNGNVTAKNVQAEFSKASIHPVALTTGVHDPAEAGVIPSRHVECADCHNPHASNSSTGTVPGSLAGTRGINSAGLEVKPITAEYQLCFRCHADSPGQPSSGTARQIAQTNTRLEFATTNPSHHAVLGPGASTKVPSLLAPWTTSSTLKCSDCHNNNAGPGAGGTGPKGPHGSTNPKLLERPYATSTPTAGDICYKCHSQTTVTKEAPHNRSEHLRYGCKACHDPHGISSTQGNTQFNSRLINLSSTDTKAVGTGATAKWYVDTVGRKCYLSCHGESHNGFGY
ncbi:MAG TPA: cytochrome c3 family protein [Rhodocyclaceae bacterium]|nr:cytochrome c3 family protein [Rhodocyclaceae bacterium]